MERNKISLPKIWEKDSIADSINRLGSCDELRSFVHSRLSDCLWLSGKNRDQSDSIVIQHIKEYIRDHYDRDLTLDDISDQVFLNPIYISRLFKKETGENFSDYLIRVRMENAVKLLQEPHYRVYEVGNKVGYHSTKYFYRIFKRFYGCTPTEYRKTLS
jgi:two-component system response regulator YesN